MKVLRALSLMLMLAAGTVAGARAQDFQLLAFNCIDLDATRARAMQFERETFPPFTDTGLFSADGQQLFYVEQGRLTIFSDQLGQTLADGGFSYLAPAGDTLGVRNDDLVDGSLLWLRFTDPFNAGQATRFAAPDAFRSLRAMTRAYAQGPQPLFVELELSPVPEGTGYLFIARLDVAPLSVVDTSASGSPLTNTGATALVVDVGTLELDGSATQSLFPGEALLVDTSGLQLQNPHEEPAIAFLVGFITAKDTGQLRTAITQAADQDHECPSS